MERKLFGHDFYFDGVSFTNAKKKKQPGGTAKQLRQKERQVKQRGVGGEGRLNQKGAVVRSVYR
jgi:hypothetical protein